MKYKYVIFDFDGTINDTSPGVYATFRGVLDSYGIDYSNIDFSKHIGPPLDFTYTEFVGAERKDEAILRHYDIYQKLNAAEMCHVYDDIPELIERLYKQGYVIALASSKYEPHAVLSLKNLHLYDYFTKVYGQTEKRGYKSEILRQLIADNGWDKSECVMIGDTLYDVNGANENGIDVIAVTYGFGKRNDLENANTVAVVDTPLQLAELLDSLK